MKIEKPKVIPPPRPPRRKVSSNLQEHPTVIHEEKTTRLKKLFAFLAPKYFFMKKIPTALFTTIRKLSVSHVMLILFIVSLMLLVRGKPIEQVILLFVCAISIVGLSVKVCNLAIRTLHMLGVTINIEFDLDKRIPSDKTLDQSFVHRKLNCLVEFFFGIVTGKSKKTALFLLLSSWFILSKSLSLFIRAFVYLIYIFLFLFAVFEDPLL